jgi:dTDP-glucose 4,6-dehydratase
MKVLLTGGAGFIGHHVAEHILRETFWSITFLDRLDCSGNLNRIAEIDNWERHRRRCRFVFHDLRAPINDQLAHQLGGHDYIIHLAALTHVDRSIADPLAAVADNVLGTAHLLEHARRGCERLVYFSTDEVFGPAPVGTAYREWDRYRSTNPYSATKAGGEELTLAYHNTYGVPAMITHTMNVFGERQHPEKYIPGTIAKVRDGELVTVHADPSRTRAGSRFYIHARNVADALLHLLAAGVAGEKYNIVGEVECDNLRLAQLIAEAVGQPLVHEMVDFHSSRPGHDLRYALDGSKMKELGWQPKVSFAQSLRRVVAWSLAHPRWLSSTSAVERTRKLGS